MLCVCGGGGVGGEEEGEEMDCWDSKLGSVGAPNILMDRDRQMCKVSSKTLKHKQHPRSVLVVPTLRPPNHSKPTALPILKRVWGGGGFQSEV